MKRAAAVLAVLVLAGCSSAAPEAEVAASAPAAPAVTQVNYQADGMGLTGTITYTTPTGQQQGEVKLPLVDAANSPGITFTDFAPGSFLYISIQNQEEAGSVSCAIKVNGKVVSENKSSGAYVIATCEASL